MLKIMEGKPVILIHGWPLSNEMWEYQIDTLVQNNFRVIAYDRRGFVNPHNLGMAMIMTL
jgi:pimeloyl-ACP methyl ester carboxylesterase